jgi:hypothetical protein
LGIIDPKSSIIGLQRLLEMRKARIWRAFLIKERIFSKEKNPWLGREDSNLDMASWKSGSLACLRGGAEPFFVEILKSFGTFEFREPHRICGLQSFGAN